MPLLVAVLGLVAVLLVLGMAALYALRCSRALASKAEWWPLRRRWVRLVGFTVLLGLCAGFFIDLSPSRRIQRQAFGRVRRGMTRAEVEALLGQPGDYFSRAPDPREYQRDGVRGAEDGWFGPSIVALAPWRPGPAAEIPESGGPGEQLAWNGDNGGIVLDFDNKGEVVGKTFHFAHIRIRWLGWVLFDTGIFWNDFPFDVHQHLVDW
jgi:hypothetical protein